MGAANGVVGAAGCVGSVGKGLVGAGLPGADLGGGTSEDILGPNVGAPWCVDWFTLDEALELVAG